MGDSDPPATALLPYTHRQCGRRSLPSVTCFVTADFIRENKEVATDGRRLGVLHGEFARSTPLEHLSALREIPAHRPARVDKHKVAAELLVEGGDVVLRDRVQQ